MIIKQFGNIVICVDKKGIAQANIMGFHTEGGGMNGLAFDIAEYAKAVIEATAEGKIVKVQSEYPYFKIARGEMVDA